MARYDAAALRRFAADILAAAGLAPDHAEVTARTLVDADLLGYVTHGIQFLPQYSAALESGAMARSGEPGIVSDNGASLVIDGRRLPGPVCIEDAISRLLPRTSEHPVVTAAIRSSENTACLATYLLRIVEAGKIGIVMTSTPKSRGVAPAGGIGGRFSANPIAFGFPAGGDPVLIDMATSATTHRLTEKMQRDGKSYAGTPLIDRDGQPTSDPHVVKPEMGGAIRPMGGDENEHKGFALALAVQALSMGLSGAGIDGGSSTLAQIIDPQGFAGIDAFRRDMADMIALFSSAPPRPGSPGVRIPGGRAMRAYREHSASGVEISDSLRRHVAQVEQKYGIRFPEAAST